MKSFGFFFPFQFEPFNLAAENSQQTFKFKKPYAYSSEDEQDLADDDVDDFEIDSTALKEILSNTGIKVGGLGHFV